MEREQNYKYQTGGDTSAECPESTINPQLDISNRDNAVADSNVAYNVTGGSQENACGSCALFDVSQRMKHCMQDGGETTGYCWSNQFKCEASAVCNKHQPGEPITEDEVSYDIAARYTEQQSPMEEPNMQPPEMIEPAMAMPEMQMAKYGGAVRSLPKASYGNQGRMPYVRRNNTGERWRNDFARNNFDRNNFAQWNEGNISGGTSLGDNGFGNLMGAVSNMFNGQKGLKNYKHNKNKFKRHNYTVDEDADMDDFMVDPENPENVLSKAEYIEQQRKLYKDNSYAEKYTDASGNPAVKFNFQNEGVIPTGTNYMGVGDLYDNADWTGLTGNPTDWGWTTEGNNGGMYSTGNPVFTEKEVITTDRRYGGGLPKAQWWNSFNDQPSNFEIPDYETILSNAGTTGNVTDFGNMSVGGNDNSNANTAGGWTPDGDPFGIGNDPFNMGDDPLGIRGESTFNNDGSQYTGSDWGDKFLEPGKNRRDYRKTQSGRLDDLTGKEKRQEKRKIKNESWDMNMDDQRDNRFGSAPLNKLNSFMDKKGVRKATRGLHDATNVIGALGAMKEASNRREQNRDFRTNQTDSATISPVSYADGPLSGGAFAVNSGDAFLNDLVAESYQVKAGGEMQFGGSNMYAPKPTCLEKAKQLGLTGSAQLAYIEKCKSAGNPEVPSSGNPMYAYGGQPEMAMQQPGMEEMAMQQPPAQSMQGDELVQEVTQALQQGADPQAVMEELVQLGISQEEASQLIGSIMQQMQGQGQQMQMAQYGNMEQVYDVDDNVIEKLIAAGAGIEII